MTDPRHSKLEMLISRTALGDRDAFEALYEATSAKLYAICVSVLKERPEAEETLQDVYILIWKNASRYASNGLSPMTWLMTIARNKAIDRLRARTSQPSSAPEDAAAMIACPAPDPETSTILSQEREKLDECLSRLDQPQARAVRSVYLEGASYAILAQREGLPLNTVRSILRRSLVRLKDCVSQ